VKGEDGGGEQVGQLRPAFGGGELVRRSVTYHRVGHRPGRWERRAHMRRARQDKRLMFLRTDAKLPQNRSKYFKASAIRRADRRGKLGRAD
jgi:hypothetical protein